MVQNEKTPGAKEAILRLNPVIADQFQGHGLGSELLERLQQVGRDWHVTEIKGDILPDNKHMQHVCAKLGFKLTYSAEEQLIIARFAL